MRLPTTRAANLAPPDPNEQVWLIEGLWGARAVGIIGGQPKCYKTFLALDLAVAVASGTPCLRRFPTPRAGRVLLFAAEDALHIVRARLEGIAHAAATEFESLDIHVISVPVLRLDHQEHQQALQATVAMSVRLWQHSSQTGASSNPPPPTSSSADRFRFPLPIGA